MSKRPPRTPVVQTIFVISLAVLSLQPALVGAEAVGHPRRTPGAAGVVPVTRVGQAGRGAVVARFDREALSQAATGHEISLRTFPLPEGSEVELELRRFQVTGPDTRFVIGRFDGPDLPLDFDPDSVVLLRGEVAGRPGSHVFLSVRDAGVAGSIRLDGVELGVSAHHPDGASLAPGYLVVYQPRPIGGGDLVPLCGADTLPDLDRPVAPAAVFGNGPTNFAPQAIRQLELAVDTDHEYFELFGNATDATAYLVELYGAVSDIYLRELGVYVTLSFTRVWDSANDLYNSEDPLTDIVLHWWDNMAGVHRDATQLLSGRRDYAYGGIAYVAVTCDQDFGFSAVGYTRGSFPNPTQPSIYNYDVHVTAHELGHNCGTGHTHAYGLDQCDNPNTTPRRGSIMSYCSQTWSGGNANSDNHFHTVTREAMFDHLNQVSCLTVDCNLNGISDGTDIANLTSPDANGNNVPDECEDCNNNSILDPADVAGPSNDVNGNGVPDECESDCNNDGEPDLWEIQVGQLIDSYGDGIPDICEEDCDGNKSSDYSQIQGSMSLDIDRNARLDACQNCDGDAQPDLVELGGAHDLWVASGNPNERLRRFFATTGVRAKQSPAAGAGVVNAGQDVLVVPDGRVLVSSASDDRVKAFDADGNFIGDLVSAGSGGLDHPAGLALSSAGVLLVASRNTDSVLSYDATTGTPLGAFVTAGSGGLESPHGLALTPQGHLLVTSSRGEVLEYDGMTGAFRRAFVSIVDNGGLDDPRGLTFKADGNLLVASFGNNLVLEYDGPSGLPLYRWAKVGTVEILNLISPWGVRVGPNGNVYVSRTSEEFGNPPPDFPDHDHDHFDTELHLTQARVYEFDVRSGNFIRTHVAGNDHGLNFASGMAFVPGWQVDCNWNQLIDSCDITSGASADTNADDIPDECQADCNGNGVYDRLDLIPYGDRFDCNFNMVPDECDIASAASVDVNSNGRPDECDGLRFEANGVHKPRYISFQTPTAAAAGVSAIRVILTSLYHPSPDDVGGPSFAAFEGQIRWVGPPAPCADHVGAATCATLQCDPHYQDWSEVGLLSVTGSEVVPSSAYTVQMMPVACTGQEATCGLEGKPIVVRTARWGDMVSSFQDPTSVSPAQPDVLDISAGVDALKELPTSIRRVRAQLQPSAIDPQAPLSILDVSRTTDAVKGGPYPFSGPTACP